MDTSLLVGSCDAESVGREALPPWGGLVGSGEVSKGGQLEEKDGVCVKEEERKTEQSKCFEITRQSMINFTVDREMFTCIGRARYCWLQLSIVHLTQEVWTCVQAYSLIITT